MAAKREDSIVALAKQKSQNRQKEVLEVINQMRRAHEKISFYSVAQKTGASKSYLYRNEVISNKIRSYRQIHTETRTSDSKDVIIKALQNKIVRLQEENRQLKEQLKTAYKY